MSDKEYEKREFARFQKHIEEVNNQSKQDKADAKSSLLDCWNTYPAIFGERVNWLLNGSYGYAEMKTALRIADNPRMNRVAGLSQLAAMCEWSCSHAVTVSAFKSLPAAKQSEINAIVQKEIDYFLENRNQFEPAE